MPPSAQILAIQAAKKARLEHDVKMRHQEAAGLARATQIREVREALKSADARARAALLRAKGEA